MSSIPVSATEPVAFPVPRKRGRPRDHSADDRILEAAAALMLERGFDNMTVDDVAAAARAGKATVYRRWASKEDLAVAALELLYRDELPVPDTGSVEQDIREFYTDVLNFAHSEHGAAYIRMTMTESLRDPRVGELHAQANSAREAAVEQMLQRGVQRGELRADVRLDFAVHYIGGVLAASVVMNRKPPTVDDLDAMLDFMFHGIRA